MQTEHVKQLIVAFVEEIWNQRQLHKLPQFLHLNFKDHSLPAHLQGNALGLTHWIHTTGLSFEHHTTIEQHITEDDKSMIKIRMRLRHIGEWRGIGAIGKTVFTNGFRLFREQEGKVIEHWGLIDENSIENQLKEESHGCQMAE